jgi:hypothetical protein
MNIHETLEIENRKANSLKVVDFIGDDAKRFADLMSFFFNDEYRISQRTAYVFRLRLIGIRIWLSLI